MKHQRAVAGAWWQTRRGAQRVSMDSLFMTTNIKRSRRARCLRCRAAVCGTGAVLRYVLSDVGEPNRGFSRGGFFCMRCYLGVERMFTVLLYKSHKYESARQRVQPQVTGLLDAAGKPTHTFYRTGRACTGEHRYLRGWYEQMVGQYFEMDEEYGSVSWQFCLVSTHRLPQSNDAKVQRADTAVRRIIFEHKAAAVRSISFVAKSLEQQESFY